MATHCFARSWSITIDDIQFSQHHIVHSAKPSFSAKGLTVTSRRRTLHIKKQCLREDRQEKVLSYGMVEMASNDDFITKILMNNNSSSSSNDNKKITTTMYRYGTVTKHSCRVAELA